MVEWNIDPDATAFAHVILRHVADDNLELALQRLTEMPAHNLTPTLDTVQRVIVLATQRGYPRLALDLATEFEASSVRRLDSAVWMNCLISSAEALYARRFLPLRAAIPYFLAGRGRPE